MRKQELGEWGWCVEDGGKNRIQDGRQEGRVGPWWAGYTRRTTLLPCYSVAQLCPTLQTHGLQHARLPCLSLSPRGCSISCPLSQWCHWTISSSVTGFFCPQSFPASRSFPMSRLFASGGQTIGASASVFPMSIQDWFSLGLTSFIFLLSKGEDQNFAALVSLIITREYAWVPEACCLSSSRVHSRC